VLQAGRVPAASRAARTTAVWSEDVRESFMVTSAHKHTLYHMPSLL
jgi:hypothetical protein